MLTVAARSEESHTDILNRISGYSCILVVLKILYNNFNTMFSVSIYYRESFVDRVYLTITARNAECVSHGR